MIFWWWLIPAISVSLAVGIAVGWRSGRDFERSFERRPLDHFNKHTFSSYGAPVDPPPITPLAPRERECSYPMCKEPTNSDWDDRCYSHSLYQDGGRP